MGGVVGVVFFIIIAASIIASIYRLTNATKKAADTIRDSKVWKEERENGNIVKRDTAIWKEEERFFTTASYEMIRDKIKEKDTTGMKISLIPDYEGEKLIVFKGKGFIATLTYLGENNGKNEFVFCFPAYLNPVGTYFPGMNYSLTVTERAFLESDSSTMTETHALQYKTERKWVL